MTYRWDTKICYVRGTGPVKSKELIKIGISTVGELLERKPLSWIYPGAVPISEAKEGMVVIKAKIKNIRWKGYHKSKCMVADLEDDTGTCVGEWYGGGTWAIQSLRSGWIATFWGKMKNGTLQNPKWTTSPSSIQNVYGGQYGVHHDTIRAALKEVLSDLDVPDLYNDFDRVMAYKGFHFPEQKEIQQMCELRLKIDEAVCLQTALDGRRRGRESVKGEVILI